MTGLRSMIGVIALCWMLAGIAALEAHRPLMGGFCLGLLLFSPLFSIFGTAA